MKKKNNLLLTLVIGVLIILSFFIAPHPSEQNFVDDEFALNAEVTRVVKDLDPKNDDLTQELEIRFLNGPQRQQIEKILNDESFSIKPRIFEVGDKVMVTYSPEQDSYYITDYVRSGTLLFLFICFIAVVILVAGFQGIGSLVGLFFSFLILFNLVLPNILAGTSPIFAAILGAFFIIPITFYSSHGISKKTTVAVISTFITLLISGVLAYIFTNTGNLTGLASDEAGYLSLDAASRIDFKQLVIAGIFISILGVLDDITISQASVTQQLKEVKHNISFSELYKRGMRVGRDHISSMVNTLILVYTGAALPLLLLFIDHSKHFNEIINLEFISEEVIRTLVGSIGLILAVPITTALAALFLKGEPDQSHHHHHH